LINSNQPIIIGSGCDRFQIISYLKPTTRQIKFRPKQQMGSNCMTKSKKTKKTRTCFFVRDSYIDHDAGHSVATTCHFDSTDALCWRLATKLRSEKTHTHTHTNSTYPINKNCNNTKNIKVKKMKMKMEMVVGTVRERRRGETEHNPF
jgi:hypothetical protein